MKKFIALLLSIISALFVLTSCSPTLLILDGKYYQRDKGIGSNYINETCVYDVSVAYQTPYQTTDYTNLNQTAKFVIDEGTLTTNLTNFDSDAQVKYGTTGYVYTSTLVVKGKYVINGVEQKIENEVTSKTYFKDFIYNFEPCYSEKQVKNSTLLNINNEYKVAYYEYGYTVNYGDKASTEITVTNDEFNHLTGLQGTFDFANYNEGAYVDNEILLFVPRTFNLSNDYSQSFKTVDVLSRKLQSMKYSTVLSNETVLIKNVNLANYTYVDKNPTLNYSGTKNVSAVLLNVKINDLFSGSAIEAYYATEQDMRHLLVEYYTKLNLNLGYLKYTLKHVTYID